MCVGSPTAGTLSSSQQRPDDEFETDRPTALVACFQSPSRPLSILYFAAFSHRCAASRSRAGPAWGHRRFSGSRRGVGRSSAASSFVRPEGGIPSPRLIRSHRRRRVRLRRPLEAPAFSLSAAHRYRGASRPRDTKTGGDSCPPAVRGRRSCVRFVSPHRGRLSDHMASGTRDTDRREPIARNQDRA